MKTVGEQAKLFRKEKGWNTTKMDAAVGTSRQSIENLEASGNRKPRYIDRLAAVMGVTVDSLYGANSHLIAPMPTLSASMSPTVMEAFQALASAVVGMDDISKATAKAVMLALIDEPSRAPELAMRLETTLHPVLEPPKEKKKSPEIGAKRAA